jgi:hypothetical protein
MSTSVLRGKGSGPARPGDGEIAIGDADREIFNCPVCQRPLATGSSRCPGCGTRLLLGIQARRAAGLLGTGGFVGAIAGGLFVAIVLLALRPTPATTPMFDQPGPGPAASAGATPQVRPVPRSASNALVRTTGLNARMAAQRPALATAVKPSKPKTSEVARVLRAIASDAGLAADAVPALAAWPEGRLLGLQLEAYYADVRATASSALQITLNNSSAYRRNGLRMVSLLDRIAEYQAAAQVLAEAHGIDLGV